MTNQHNKPTQQTQPPQQPFRIGHGYDIHRLETNTSTNTDDANTSTNPTPLIIAGVTIPHDSHPVAHSDGDVVYHAVTDAILGALSLPDLGQLFPDTDPNWQNTDSNVFIAEADRLMRNANYIIANLDITIICQRPTLAPYKKAMQKNLAFLLGTHTSQINIKSKTHENLADPIGQNQALAAHAIILLTHTPPHP